MSDIETGPSDTPLTAESPSRGIILYHSPSHETRIMVKTPSGRTYNLEELAEDVRDILAALEGFLGSHKHHSAKEE